MTDLTVIGRRSMHLPGRAKPRGHIACLRRQAEPSAVLLLGRYAEHRGLWNLFLGRARRYLTVSAVCGRRNEAIALRRCLRIAAAEWSGCKAGESVIVRGRNRADAWRVGSGSAPAPGRDQAQVSAR